MNLAASRPPPTARIAGQRHDARALRDDQEWRENLARHHDDMVDAAKQLDRLLLRLDSVGADALSRMLAGAIAARIDRLTGSRLPEAERQLLQRFERKSDTASRNALDRLRMDHAWIATNWRDLRPVLDGLASGCTWVDTDALRDAGELFAALVREHVHLESNLLVEIAPLPQFGADGT